MKINWPKVKVSQVTKLVSSTFQPQIVTMADSEKSTLLPTAPADQRFIPGTSQPAQPQQTYIPMPKFVLVPGLEFDASRRYRYGTHAFTAAALIFASFILIELRDCNFGIGIDLDRLQALHVSLMVFAFVIFLLSLFGIADYIFQYKIFFLIGVLMLWTFSGLMVWMTYEAATNPCVKTGAIIPGDFSLSSNVFARGDGVGIITLLLDSFATIMMFSTSINFYKRH